MRECKMIPCKDLFFSRHRRFMHTASLGTHDFAGPRPGTKETKESNETHCHGYFTAGLTSSRRNETAKLLSCHCLVTKRGSRWRDSVVAFCGASRSILMIRVPPSRWA